MRRAAAAAARSLLARPRAPERARGARGVAAAALFVAGNGDNGRLGVGPAGGGGGDGDGSGPANARVLARVRGVGAAMAAAAFAPASARVPAASERAPGRPCDTIACGGTHTAFIDVEGSVWTFGANDRGQLGRPEVDTTNGSWGRPGRVRGLRERAVAVAAGHHHTLVALADGSVMSFGCNASGQLGTGPSLTATAGRAPALVASLGDERVVSVAAGASHSLVATDGGAVFAFGSRKDGVLGKDEKRSFLTGFLPGAAVRAMGAAPPQHYPAQVPGTGTGEGCFFAARVAAGHHHSAALTDRGAVYTWGRGRDYQLGHGDHASTSRARRLRGASTGPLAHIACGGYHTLLVGGGGGVWAVGNNEHGCLGTGAQPGTVHGEPERCVGLEGARVVSAAAGWKHSAAVDESGRLFTWGWGGSSGMVDAWASSGGQLCSGRDRDRWEAGQVELPQGARVTAVACGFNHTAAIVEAASESELERVTDQLDAAAGTA